MKIFLKKHIPALIILILTWILGVYFYNVFDERVITHWNFNGVADGYSGKGFGAFLVPIISTLLFLLFTSLPHIDPKQENYSQFEKTYEFLKIIFLSFFLILSGATGLANLRVNVPIGTVVPALVGILFIFIGSVVGKIKQNWFIGFRFPWTLASESVWNKTNRFGGFAMMFCGGLLLIVPLLPGATGMALFITSIFAMVFGTMLYSFLLFKKESKH